MSVLFFLGDGSDNTIVITATAAIGDENSLWCLNPL
jgi:hypothetical protein